MTYRPQPKYASKDATLGAWTTCDDCGFIWNQSKMQFQYDYVGGPIPQNQNWLRCPRCIAPLTYQRKLLIIPPDPPPLYNTRPEPYTVEETNWLTTMDGEQYQTVAGSDYITSIPNPGDNANTSVLVLTSSLSLYGGTLSVAYLDLFDGDPNNGGVSILEAITGSATRTNVFADLTANNDGVLQNSAVITVVAQADPLPNWAQAVANVSFVGIYDAATDGALLVSGPVGATFPTIVQTAVVQFNQIGLQIEPVFGTWNPDDKGTLIALSNADLTATKTASGDYQNVFSIGSAAQLPFGLLEVVTNAATDPGFGFGNTNRYTTDGRWLGIDENTVGVYPAGDVWHGGIAIGSGPTFTTADRIEAQVSALGIRWKVNGGAWGNWVALSFAVLGGGPFWAGAVLHHQDDAMTIGLS